MSFPVSSVRIRDSSHPTHVLPCLQLKKGKQTHIIVASFLPEKRKRQCNLPYFFRSTSTPLLDRPSMASPISKFHRSCNRPKTTSDPVKNQSIPSLISNLLSQLQCFQSLNRLQSRFSSSAHKFPGLLVQREQVYQIAVWCRSGGFCLRGTTADSSHLSFRRPPASTVQRITSWNRRWVGRRHSMKSTVASSCVDGRAMRHHPCFCLILDSYIEFSLVFPNSSCPNSHMFFWSILDWKLDWFMIAMSHVFKESTVVEAPTWKKYLYISEVAPWRSGKANRHSSRWDFRSSAIWQFERVRATITQRFLLFHTSQGWLCIRDSGGANVAKMRTQHNHPREK